MSHIYFVNPKHGSRYNLYSLGVEGDEEEGEMQSQPAILEGPCARGKLGPCARGSRGHDTGLCTRGALVPASYVVRGHVVSAAHAHGVTWDFLYCCYCTPS